MRRRQTSSCFPCCSKVRRRRSSNWRRSSPFTATHLSFLEQLTQSLGVVLNTIEATMRTENLLQQSQQLTLELQTRQTRTAADQRRTGIEGKAARRTERGSRTQEQGSRTGPPRSGREGGRTGAHLEVQIRVPGEHVARIAHAAEFHSDSRPAAGGKSGRQSHVEAGGLCAGTFTPPARIC